MRQTALPGTTIEAAPAHGAADRQLTPMFSGGGLVLSQVCQLTGLEGYIIQNWVKRKILPPPVGKKYSRNQLCRLFHINLLKDTFTLEQSAGLLSYINGSLTDESDDLIDDSRLYAYLVDCLAALGGPERLDLSRAGETVKAVTADYHPPRPGAENRLWMVLEIMLTACEAQQIQRQALELYGHLDYK